MLKKNWLKRLWIYALLFVLTACALDPTVTNNSNELDSVSDPNYVINGTEVTGYNENGVVSLSTTGIGSSTGTLLNNKWVLTAKHCVDVNNMKATTVKYSPVSSYSEYSRSSLVIGHPTLDVAVVLLYGSFHVEGSSGYERPIYEDSNSSLVGQTLLVQGYGRNTLTDGYGKLREADLIISSADSTNMICYPNSDDQIQYKGDSGSTAFLNLNGINYITGVFSMYYYSLSTQEVLYTEMVGPEAFRGWVYDTMDYVNTNPPTLFIIQNNRLHRVNKDSGAWYVMGPPAWDGLTSMTSIGDSLYIVQNNRLHKVNKFSGSWQVIGPVAWDGHTCMTSIGDEIFIIQNGRLYKVNKDTGSYSQLGPAAWDGFTCMTSIGDDLFVYQNSRLYKIDKETGGYCQIGGAVWSGTTSMTSIGDDIFMVENSRLYRVNKDTGSYVQLGPVAWDGPTTMASIGNDLYITQNNRLYKVNKDTGSYVQLGPVAWDGTTSMTGIE